MTLYTSVRKKTSLLTDILKLTLSSFLSPKHISIDILKLNVRGMIILTSRSTLISDPQTALAMMFALDQPLASTTMIDGGHFIDADPECFQVLLNWLTYRKVLLPRNLTPQSVAAVAEVYGM